MNPVYEKALDAIWKNINGGIDHPNDFGRVVVMFSRLLDANQKPDNLDDINNYLQKKHGVDEEVAHDIQLIYETLLEARKEYRYWDEKFIQNLLGN